VCCVFSLVQYFEEVLDHGLPGRRFRLENPGELEIIALGAVRGHGFLFETGDDACPGAPYHLLQSALDELDKDKGTSGSDAEGEVRDEDEGASGSDAEDQVPGRASVVCDEIDVTADLMPHVTMVVVDAEGRPCLPYRCSRVPEGEDMPACRFIRAGVVHSGRRASFTPTGPVVVSFQKYKCSVHGDVVTAMPAQRFMLSPTQQFAPNFVRLGPVSAYLLECFRFA
jgi:hypothetical protein